ncbi:sensor histidine kinase [Halobacterium jilantaiense]|uniref:histidine kinase n=1 Tax=Halobacterium jilantaiense TaxID=355548 RepID=A0A1I0QQU2_9EURY|nr:ATP-binding protein [Halobacterium jilantaiense]SEW29898.1 Signal transduction histidine kinase [Halobacterium jilantaiense]
MGARARGSSPAIHWWFYAYAVLGVVAGVAYGFLAGWTLSTALEVLIVLSLASTLVYSGVDARDRPLSARGLARAVGLTTATGASFALLAVAIAAIWLLEGHPVVDAEFMVVFGMWLGLAVGAQASLYVAASEEKRTRLADLVKLLTMNQRVLRHNLRNQLSVVDGHLQNLERDAGTDDHDIEVARHHLEKLLETSESARRILNIWESDERRALDAAAVVAAAAERAQDDYPDADIGLGASEDATVSAHPALEDAVYELLSNAVEHNDDDVSVSASVRNPPGREVVIEVADTGPGVPASERQVFDQPEETSLSHASGLGLWFVYWTVRESGGRVAFDDTSGGQVSVRLPDADGRQSPWASLLGR